MELLKLLSQRTTDNRSNSNITIAFLGDSITQGCFEASVNSNNQIDTIYDPESAYHSQLRRMFYNICPSVPLNIINSGKSGDSAVQGSLRVEKDILRYYPDLVVVCFGLNDAFIGKGSINDYIESLRNIFDKLKREKIDTIFMTPNMMNTYVSPLINNKVVIDIAEHAAQTQNNGTMDMFMDYTRELCAKENVQVCDCYSKWKYLFNCGVDTTQLLANKINHPSREMHRLFANDLFNMIMFNK